MYPPSNIVELAVKTAMKSACRSKRGAVIFHHEYPVATGFNDKPDCDGSLACKKTCGVEAVHAEQNALLSLPWSGSPSPLEMLHVKAVDGALVVSSPPSCVQCSKLIRHVNLAAMWLYRDYGRNRSWVRYGIDDFHRLSVENSCSK